MQRIENGLGRGTPDVYFAVGIDGGMLELKVSSGKRKLVIDYPIHQRVWARKHVERGGYQLLAVEHLGEVYWWSGMASVHPEENEPFHTGLEWPCRM